MKAPVLSIKLARDLWEIRSQAIAIALVVGSGIALFFAMRATFDSLYRTRDDFYREYRFADVFASAKRAPERLLTDIRAIPGVGVAETRVVVGVTLDVPGMDAPAKGLLVSIPESGRPLLNDVAVVHGRWIDGQRPDEVVVTEAFADAHGFELGDQVVAIINGRRKALRVVGFGMAPEYTYLISAGDLFPDEKRFGVFWMARRPLATAFDMEGGFNDVSLALAPGAVPEEVIARLDQVLEPYGGFGAVTRAHQVSNWYLQNELDGLAAQARIIPTIFLLVAVFLVNVVLSRVISVQRQQIAALKALGRSNFEIGVHYASWALAICLGGCLFGVAAGLWMTRAMLGLYLDYFAFPELRYDFAPMDLLSAFVMAGSGAVLGALGSVRSAVTLPAAQAMRPPAPPNFRRTWIEALVGGRWFSQPTRIILRNIIRVPTRTSLSVLGIAMAVAIMLVGSGFLDAVDELSTVQFDLAQRQDVMVTFVEPVSSVALFELLRFPGVEDVEPMRSVPVVLRSGHKSHQTALLGLPETPRLMRAVDTERRAQKMPTKGLMLSSSLAKLLEVRPGDLLTVEVREGRRPKLVLPVARTIDDYMGTSAYLEIGELRGLMQESGTLSAALLEVDTSHSTSLYHKLKHTPRVAGVALRQATIDNFDQYLKENMAAMMGFNLLFAGIIAFGVVYNTARISLSERSRDLASLRVLGLRRGEISYILLGEQAVLVLLAIPVGLLMGRAMLAAAVGALETELYRFPFVLHADTHVFAALTVIVAAAVSALVVRRRLDRLDLVEVLKTRE